MGRYCGTCRYAALCDTNKGRNRFYFIGFSVIEGEKGNRLLVDATRCLDELDCELWEYFGPREVTKKHLKANKRAMLAWVEKTMGLFHDRPWVGITIQ